MSAHQTLQWQDVQDTVGAQRLQQMLFGQNVLNIGTVEEGGIVQVALHGAQAADRLRPRKRPPALPRPVPEFVDREQEQKVVGQSLALGQLVGVHGADGAGKTALVKQTMHTQLPTSFPDGRIYLSARHEAREDLFQELVESFYETGDGHVKLTENRARRFLDNKQALIAIDDANYLKEEEVKALAEVVPRCAILITSRKQLVWQRSSVELRGLPRDEAVRLFEQNWGPVSQQDRPAVEAICHAVDDMPDLVIKAALIAAKRNVPPGEMAGWLQADRQASGAVDRAVRAIGSRLSEGERRMLGALASLGTASMDLQALQDITGLPLEKVQRYLARLQKMGLVHIAGPRYSLDDSLRPYIRHYGADAGMRERAAAHFARRAGQLRGQSKDPDEENVVAALGHYARHQQWPAVIQITRAMEVYLATTGRWGQWRKRLHNAWQAAQQIGDRATEAWAQNQLGIIAMGLPDPARAAAFFKGALAIWQALGNQRGMTIARWNLQVLFGAPPPPPPKAKPPTEPGGLSPVVKIAMVVTAIVVSTLGGLIVWDILRPPATPTPTRIVVPPEATTVTPSPTPSRVTITPTPIPSHTPTPTRTHTPTPTPTRTHTPTPSCWCGNGVCDSGPPCYENVNDCPDDCPMADLVVVSLIATGPGTINVEGQPEVPIRVVVRNQGGTPAGIFKVSTSYSMANGTYLVAFTVAGQGNSWFPYTSTTLEAGTKVTFEGVVTFGSWVQGETISLTALADSCASEEFAESYCRVEESNEYNNESAAISLALPASGPEISDVFFSPPSPTTDDNNGVGAYITDPVGVDHVRLWYRHHPDGDSTWSWQYEEMILSWMDEDLYAGGIGVVEQEGDMEYLIEAWNTDGRKSQAGPFWQRIEGAPPPAPEAYSPGYTDLYESVYSCPVTLGWSEVYHTSSIAYYEVNLQECEPDRDPCWDYRTFTTSSSYYDISSEVPTAAYLYYLRWNVRAIDEEHRVGEWSEWLYFKMGGCP